MSNLATKCEGCKAELGLMYSKDPIHGFICAECLKYLLIIRENENDIKLREDKKP